MRSAPCIPGKSSGDNLKHHCRRKLAQLWARQAVILRRLNPRRHMAKARTHKPRRTSTKRSRANQEDRLTGLYTQVDRALTKWLIARGIYSEGNCRAKKVDYLGED
jgi:hypothetical protein